MRASDGTPVFNMGRNAAMTSSGTYNAQELLTTAIALENEGKANYLEAAKVVTDDGVRAVFEKLAAQENAHREYLQRVLDSFKQARGWPEKVDIPQELLETARQNLFPEVKDADPKSYANAVDAIRRAIQMEVDAIAFYKGVSAMAKDQSARNMFNTLALWEEDHLFIMNYWLGLTNR